MELTVKREGSGDGVWQVVKVPGARLLGLNQQVIGISLLCFYYDVA